jgi:hypothetical protein
MSSGSFDFFFGASSSAAAASDTSASVRVTG